MMYFDPQAVLELDPDTRDHGELLLHLAVRRGRLYIVKHLLERGASLIWKSHEGKNAMQIAQEIGNREMIELLCRYSAAD